MATLTRWFRFGTAKAFRCLSVQPQGVAGGVWSLAQRRMAKNDMAIRRFVLASILHDEAKRQPKGRYPSMKRPRDVGRQQPAPLEQLDFEWDDSLIIPEEVDRVMQKADTVLQSYWDQWHKRPIEQYVACDFRDVWRALFRSREVSWSKATRFAMGLWLWDRHRLASQLAGSRWDRSGIVFGRARTPILGREWFVSRIGTR